MRRASALLGCLLVSVALCIIWGARLGIPRAAYVSEIGAVGEVTAPWFRGALLLIVAGGSAIAWAGRGIRSSFPVLGRTTPAVSLWIGCAFFLLAAEVPCTAGCPLPMGDSFTWQDLVHTVAAVLAFASACVAMLQTSFAIGHRGLARSSLATGLAVACLAGVVGLLSLARMGTDVGSAFELVATTLAIGWLVVFGAAVARGTGQDTGADLLASVGRAGGGQDGRDQIASGQVDTGQLDNGQLGNGQLGTGQLVNGQLVSGQLVSGQLGNGQFVSETSGSAATRSLAPPDGQGRGSRSRRARSIGIGVRRRSG